MIGKERATGPGGRVFTAVIECITARMLYSPFFLWLDALQSDIKSTLNLYARNDD